MLSFTDWYGRQTLSADPGFAPMALVERASGVPAGAFYARLVGWRERQRMIYEPLIFDRDGDEIRNRSLDIIFRNGATKPVSMEGRGVDVPQPWPGSPYQFAEKYAVGMNIPIGPGSKIQEGQPRGGDIIWIGGSLVGRPVYSDISITGLYSSDIVGSPIFVIEDWDITAGTAEDDEPGVEPPTNPVPPAVASGIVQRLQLANGLISGAIHELSK